MKELQSNPIVGYDKKPGKIFTEIGQVNPRPANKTVFPTLKVGDIVTSADIKNISNSLEREVNARLEFYKDITNLNTSLANHIRYTAINTDNQVILKKHIQDMVDVIDNLKLGVRTNLKDDFYSIQGRLTGKKTYIRFIKGSTHRQFEVTSASYSGDKVYLNFLNSVGRNATAMPSSVSLNPGGSNLVTVYNLPSALQKQTKFRLKDFRFAFSNGAPLSNKSFLKAFREDLSNGVNKISQDDYKFTLDIVNGARIFLKDNAYVLFEWDNRQLYISCIKCELMQFEYEVSPTSVTKDYDVKDPSSLYEIPALEQFTPGDKTVEIGFQAENDSTVWFLNSAVISSLGDRSAVLVSKNSVFALDALIKANDVNLVQTQLNTAEVACMCHCNYCACNCNYTPCPCHCNYCACNCNNCPCNCNRCTCDSHCPCNCNRCTCDNDKCPCNCNRCTCDNHRPCSCDNHVTCPCNCNYKPPCTCDCNNCPCNCNNCPCHCNFCPCHCNYCACDCNFCPCNCNYNYCSDCTAHNCCDCGAA